MASDEHREFPPKVGDSLWRSEPFRIFFPAGVIFAWVGVGHWLMYASGVLSSYSCRFHGLVQMQAFMMAFAAGFLLTAIPRRTQSPAASSLEIGAIALTLTTITIAAIADSIAVAEIAYASLFVLIGQFAVRRFVGQSA